MITNLFFLSIFENTQNSISNYLISFTNYIKNKVDIRPQVSLCSSLLYFKCLFSVSHTKTIPHSGDLLTSSLAHLLLDGDAFYPLKSFAGVWRFYF